MNFNYLGLFILYFVIKNENVLKLCALVGSH